MRKSGPIGAWKCTFTPVVEIVRNISFFLWRIEITENIVCFVFHKDSFNKRTVYAASLRPTSSLKPLLTLTCSASRGLFDPSFVEIRIT